MRIRQIYISPSHIYAGHYGREPGDQPMLSVPEVECIAGSGLRGDRYFDHKQDYKGQATFFALETHERLCALLAESGRDTSVYRRNIITSGIDLNELIGQEFEVQGIRFSGTEECRPCSWMERAYGPGAEQALRGYGGLRARILTSGTLRVDA